jgi:xanthine dehydrogenase YagT iron-sulfur-binding subunit
MTLGSLFSICFANASICQEQRRAATAVSAAACTVIVDGRRINSCLALAVSHDGAHVLTIEGVADGNRLHPVQEAFLAHDGLQCGFCTPGQIMSAIGLINEGEAGPDPERVREGMSGNLCRCGAYQGITQAVLDAQKAPVAAGRKEAA